MTTTVVDGLPECRKWTALPRKSLSGNTSWQVREAAYVLDQFIIRTPTFFKGGASDMLYSSRRGHCTG